MLTAARVLPKYLCLMFAMFFGGFVMVGFIVLVFVAIDCYIEVYCNSKKFALV